MKLKTYNNTICESYAGFYYIDKADSLIAFDLVKKEFVCIYSNWFNRVSIFKFEVNSVEEAIDIYTCMTIFS